MSNAKKHIALIRWALGVILAIDVGLVILNLRGPGSPQQLRAENNRFRAQLSLLEADVKRGKSIQRDMDKVQGDCDRFFAEELRPATRGYSAIEADLGAIAGKAGLRTDAVTFRQRDISGRGVVEIEVAAAVEGDYANVINFINGLERSNNFYVLDGLSLASSTAGNLRLNLQLRTYFRS